MPLVSRGVLQLKSFPRPVGDAEAVRHIIGGLVVAGHRCRGRPSEVVVQHLSQRGVVGQFDVSQSLVEASDGAPIHLVVHPVTAVDPNDGGLVAIGLGIQAGSTECLGPISGEALDMLGMETVAERMANYFVGHYPTMPGSGKTAHSVDAARCLEDSTHASMMTSVSHPGKAYGRGRFDRIYGDALLPYGAT